MLRVTDVHSKTAALAHDWREVADQIATAPRLLLDLRSPKEFAHGHIPGAVNLALLDNDERARIGTLYKQRGKLEAMQAGLELFAEKAEAFYAELTAQRAAYPSGSEIFLYCWRGGLRSRLTCVWLASLGLKVGLVRGGYKAYRHTVAEDLTALACHPLLVLNGRTGSGKTALLHELQREGLPVLDFEGLAHHRGSAFGGLAQKQACPSQQQFENNLAAAYASLRQAREILVEIEGVIGPIALSKDLRQQITKAPMVFVEREFDDRVRLITATYAEGWDEQAHRAFRDNLEHLRRFVSKDQYDSLLRAVAKQRFDEAVACLLAVRYDKAYDKSLQRHQAQAIAHFNLSTEAERARSFLRARLRSPL